MSDSNRLYSIFDLIEDKEVLTMASGKEASQFLGVRPNVIYVYSQNGANFKRRYRITRHEELNDLRDEWVISFEKEWEFICNYLNPNRKIGRW